MNHPTPFKHADTGLPIVISDGLNGTGRMDKYSVYQEKPNGTLERCTEFDFYNTPAEAAEALKAYHGTTLIKRDLL